MSNGISSGTPSDSEISFNIHDSRAMATIIMIGILLLASLSAIGVEKFWNRPLRTIFSRKKKRRSTIWYRLKRWTLLAFLLALNIGAMIIVYCFGSERATMTIIVVAKAKDIFCTIILPLYYIYKRCANYNGRRQLLDGQGKTIVSIIPVYKESLEEITYTMDSIICNSTRMYQMLVVIICDGCVPLVDSLMDDKKMVEASLTYRSWKDVNVECEVVYGYRGKTPLVIVKKNTNMEKKDSLILAYDVFNSPRIDAAPSCITFRTSLIEQINLLFQIEQYDYMFFTDADSFIKPDSLTNLIDELEYRGAAAACGLVMVDFQKHCGGFWNIYQNFQYLYGQYIRRNTENIIKQVTCLPGCITMVKTSSRIIDVITDYGRMPFETNLIRTTVQRLGTDRRLTHLFLLHQLRTCMVDSAVCYTKPPQSWYRLLTQRRRWGSNAFFNSSLNFWSMKIHPLIRISSLFDLIKMSLAFFRLFNIGLFISQLTVYFDIKTFLPQLIFLAYPLFYFLLFSICKRTMRLILHKILLGYMINTIFSRILSTGIMATVFYNIGNFSWGPTENTSKMKRRSLNIYIIPFSQPSYRKLSTATPDSKKKHWSFNRRVLPL